VANPVAVLIPSRTAVASSAFIPVASTAAQQSLVWKKGYILIAQNSGASSRTVTIVNNPKSSRSSNTITAEAILAGAFRVYPRFPAQDNDVLLVTTSHAEVLLSVIKAENI
jgi:hypothetical protein